MIISPISIRKASKKHTSAVISPTTRDPKETLIILSDPIIFTGTNFVLRFDAIDDIRLFAFNADTSSSLKDVVSLTSLLHARSFSFKSLLDCAKAVSYTHLTLPTILRV